MNALLICLRFVQVGFDGLRRRVSVWLSVWLSIWALCVCVSVGMAGDPWGLVDSFAGDIDVVAVMENPAKQLLSESGQASRSFLGSIGVFSSTRRAWGGLGELFGTDSDGVVEELLSGRVVLFVDSLFEQADNPFALINSADRNWVVMAEVDDAVMMLLRKKLKPVPREIVAGVPVYGIESGRYSLVMLRGGVGVGGGVGGHTGRVMLSPKGGRGLLERVLVGFLDGPGDDVAVVRPRWDGAGDWSLAVRVRVDELLGESEFGRRFGIGGVGGGDGPEHVRLFGGVGQGGAGQEGVWVSLAMPFDGELPGGSAPVGLLGAMGDGVVMAMAGSSIFALGLDDPDGVSIGFRDEDQVHGGAVLEPEGVLFVLMGEDFGGGGGGGGGVEDGPVGITVLSVFPEVGRDGSVDAAMMDGLIEPLVFEGGDGRGGGLFPEVEGGGGGGVSYAGLFPGAVRTQSVVDVDGSVGLVSWKTTARSGSTDLIFSIGDEGIETGGRVRMLDETVGAFQAIGGGLDGGDDGMAKSNAVILRGFFRVGTMMESLSDVKWSGGEGYLSLVDVLNWEVVGDEGVLRGTVEIQKRRD